MMELRYNPKANRHLFIIAFLLIALNIAGIIIYESSLGWNIVLALGFLFMAIYRSYKPYVVIRDGYIKKDFGGKIPLDEITGIRRHFGDCIIESAKKKIKISKDALDKAGQEALGRLADDWQNGRFHTE